MKKNLSRISFIVHQKEIFDLSNNILCGLSGGQDSILLVIILYHLRNYYNLKSELVYCNHLWTTKNFYTLFQLFKVSYLLQIPFNTSIANHFIKSEEDGHFWRQQIFFEIANYSQQSFLVLGHTLTDRVETALWHFLRGTSPNGLLSLKQSRNIYSNILSNRFFVFNRYTLNSSITKVDTQFLKKSNLKFLTRKNLYIESQNYFCKSKRKVVKNVLFPSSRLLKFKKQTSMKIFNKNSFLISFSTNFNSYKYRLVKKNYKNYTILRPLLNFPRPAISKLVRENNLPLLNDRTNQSKKLMRNKIRLILLPLFHYYIQTKSETHVGNYMNISDEEQTYLSNIIFKIIEKYSNNPDFRTSTILFSTPMQFLLIKKILESYTSKQIKKTHFEKMNIFLKK